MLILLPAAETAITEESATAGSVFNLTPSLSLREHVRPY